MKNLKNLIFSFFPSYQVGFIYYLCVLPIFFSRFDPHDTKDFFKNYPSTIFQSTEKRSFIQWIKILEEVKNH